MTQVLHTIEPIYDDNSRVLILGTMPSPKSREAQFYYAHPQNRFWPTLAKLLGAPLPESREGKRALALAHGIAIWDVLQSCEIDGASDASIRNAVPNDLRRILDAAPIQAVFCTGKKSCELYNRFCLNKMTELEAVCLPSSSPANRRISDDELLNSYREILRYIDCKQQI